MILLDPVDHTSSPAQCTGLQCAEQRSDRSDQRRDGVLFLEGL